MKKYNLETIRLINLFESVTRTNVKDCFYWNNIIMFIVKDKQGRKAVGQNGKNVKRVSTMINKKIKIVEYNSHPVKFIKSFISPIVSKNIEIVDNVLLINVDSTKDKGLLIGRDSKNIKMLRELVKKYFNLEGVKIV